MRWRRIFFLVICVLAVMVFLSVLNGHRMINSSVSALMSDTRKFENFPNELRNFLSQQVPRSDLAGGPKRASLHSKYIISDQKPNGDISIRRSRIPADEDIWPKLNQSSLSALSSTSSPHSHRANHSRIKINNLPDTREHSEWPVQQCTPRKNIVFFKMHKCSSSTVQNILFRYGEKHNLDFVIPPAGNYLGHSPFNKKFMLPLPTKEYNILCYHTRFSERGIEEVMPADSVYVSILREPVSMYESMFTYTQYKSIYHLTAANPLKQFLDSPHRYYDTHGGKDHAKNPMMYDFGLDNHLKDDQAYIEGMIEGLDKRFDLIMMTEYFHESLILFKELMCWSLDDIVYFTLNARSKLSVQKDITPAMKDKMKQWNLGDFKLYDHFNKTFWQKVRKFGEERMQREIQQLVERNEYLYKKCIDRVSDNDGRVWHPPGVKVESLQVKPSAKNDQQCQAMARTELPYTEILRKKMKAKYHLHI